MKKSTHKSITELLKSNCQKTIRIEKIELKTAAYCEKQAAVLF